MRPLFPLLLCLGATTGCAIKSTVALGQMEQAWDDANAVNAEEAAPYEYTLAEQYRLKAQEEWGYSDYQASEELAEKARSAARQAEEITRYGRVTDGVENTEDILRALDGAEDIVPEEVERKEDVPIEDDGVEIDWD